MEAVSKPLMEHVDPFGLTLLRFSAGLVVLLAAAASTGRLGELAAPGRRAVAQLLFMGFLNTFLSMSLLQIAVRNSSAASAATVICSNPIMVLLLGVAAGRERFSLTRLAAFAAGAAGVYLVTGSGVRTGTAGGALPALGAAAVFAVYTLMGKSLVERVTPLAANIVSFAGGVASLGVFILADGRAVFEPGWTPGAADLAAMLWLGIVVSGAGYLAFFGMLKSGPASSASLVFFVKPVVATVLALALLGEVPGPGFLPGLALVTAGSAAGLASGREPLRGPAAG